jgi:hypothetical protein
MKVERQELPDSQEPEVENIVYSGSPDTAISPDMTPVYRLIAQHPRNLRPVVELAGEPPEFPAGMTDNG